MRYSFFLKAVLLLALCAGCHNHTHDHDGHDHEAEEMHEGGHHHSADDIILEPAKAKAAGVKVEVVQPGTFHDVIQASGKVTAASCDETTVVATVSGLVIHAHDISEGMRIAGGTTLYYVSSAKLQEGDLARRALLELKAAEREYERMKPLVEDKIVTEKDFNVVKAEYEKASLAYKAVGENTTERGVAVKAPVTGFVKDCMVKDGDYVEVGTPLMTITKNQHLYLRAEVPVRYYSSLGNVSSAKFRTQYSTEMFDLEQMNGQLLSSGKSAVSTTSYVPVTFQFDNKDQVIPGAYAEVFLITGEREGVVSLPQSAITEEQGLYYVYLQKDAHSYTKREVVLGATDGERTEIKTGLQGGEHVVVRGAINVKLAGASKAIPGHTHNH